MAFVCLSTKVTTPVSVQYTFNVEKVQFTVGISFNKSCLFWIRYGNFEGHATCFAQQFDLLSWSQLIMWTQLHICKRQYYLPKWNLSLDTMVPAKMEPFREILEKGWPFNTEHLTWKYVICLYNTGERSEPENWSMSETNWSVELYRTLALSFQCLLANICRFLTFGHEFHLYDNDVLEHRRWLPSICLFNFQIVDALVKWSQKRSKNVKHKRRRDLKILVTKVCFFVDVLQFVDALLAKI